jgi:hypothetical protein
MKLSGYRSSDCGLLSGRWLPGELLAWPQAEWPALAEQVTVAAPVGRLDDRLCVVSGTAFVRFCEIDWVARRARLEIGMQDEARDAAPAVLEGAIAHGTGVLGLRRLHGWVTPAVQPPTDLLAKSGFTHEATIPCALWHGGRQLARQIWGRIADD